MAKKFIIRDSIAGNVIEEASSLEEAEKIVDEYEKEDKKDGIYEEGFYEIVEVDEDIDS